MSQDFWKTLGFISISASGKCAYGWLSLICPVIRRSLKERELVLIFISNWMVGNFGSKRIVRPRVMGLMRFRKILLMAGLMMCLSKKSNCATQMLFV